jgi:RNA polymerase sigma factor (sigma-70 family)
VCPDLTPHLAAIRHEARRVWLSSPRSIDLDDLCQEAAYGVLRNLHKYDPSASSLPTYVRKLARWAALDYVRGSSASGARPCPPVRLLQLYDITSPPDAGPAGVDLADLCRHLLSHATAAQRRCLALYFLAGLKMAAAAAELGITEAGVSRNVKAGLATIRAAATPWTDPQHLRRQ